MAIEGLTNNTAALLPVITGSPMDNKTEGIFASRVIPSEQNESSKPEARAPIEPLTPPKVDEKYIERINKALDMANIGREYKVYDKLGKVYIRLFNKESGELIREIPPERMIEIAKRMEELNGLLFQHKA